MRLRPDTPADRALLRRVYASTREIEMGLVDWPDAQKQAFLDMQFEAQDRHYRGAYPEAAFLVVEHEGVPAGRLVVDRGGDAIHIVDLALLPTHRGQGLGGALLQELIDEGRATRRPVRIYVERSNRARSLYDRLGFVVIGEGDVHHLMEWRAAPTA